jgi:ELWxxDGT repeat protein
MSKQRRLAVEPLEARCLMSATLVKDLNTNPGSSDPNSFAVVGNNLFFAADDGIHGRELWKTDDTTGDTSLVKDLYPGGSSSDPNYLTNVNGTVFFEASDATHTHALWKSDGTDAGTVLVKDTNPGGSSGVQDLLNVNGALFFIAMDPGSLGSSGRLWKSDGTLGVRYWSRTFIPTRI